MPEDLLIIADDFDQQVIAMLALNVIKSGLRINIIKAPSMNQYKTDIFEDLSLLTGGFVFSRDNGLLLHDYLKKDLGKAKGCIVKLDKTILIPLISKLDPKTKELIQENINNINKEIKNTDDDFILMLLNIRKSVIQGSIGELTVGATTDMELQERRS